MYIQIYPNLSKYFIELHIYSSMFPKKLLDENCSAFFSSGKWEKSTWTLLGGMEWQWNVRAFVGCRKYGWANRRFLQCSFRADGLVSSSTANRTTQPTVFVCKYERAGHGVHSAANFYDFLCKILSIYIYIYGVCLKTGQPWGPRIYWLIKQPIVQHPNVWEMYTVNHWPSRHCLALDLAEYRSRRKRTSTEFFAPPNSHPLMFLPGFELEGLKSQKKTWKSQQSRGCTLIVRAYKHEWSWVLNSMFRQT